MLLTDRNEWKNKFVFPIGIIKFRNKEHFLRKISNPTASNLDFELYSKEILNARKLRFVPKCRH